MADVDSSCHCGGSKFTYEELMHVVDWRGVRVNKAYFEYAMSKGIALIIEADHAIVDDRPKAVRDLGVDYHKPVKPRKRRKRHSPLEERPRLFCSGVLEGRT